MSVILKSKADIEAMRVVGQFVREVHQQLKELVRPGQTTAKIDALAHELCRSRGAKPAFLGYPASKPGVVPFPGVTCCSPNSVIVHGIPDEVGLRDGDILSIDFGCELGGFFGDSAYTYAVGEVDTQAAKLMKVTEEALEVAISECISGKRLGDISAAVQRHVEGQGFGVVRDFVGHGIGRSMHESPQVPNFGKPGQGRLLKPGMVLAIEPMITAGDYSVKILDDGWTAVTKDGSLAAHFEHTVAITDNKPIILTA